MPAPDSRRTAILGWKDADPAIYIDNESPVGADANMDMNSEREDYSLEIRQLLRDVLPSLSDVAVFLNTSNPFHATGIRQAREAAQPLRINLR